MPGTAAIGISGNANEHLVLAQLGRGGRFIVDQHLDGVESDDTKIELLDTGTSHDIEESDNGKTYVMVGGGSPAIAADFTFNLPNAEPGLVYRFFNEVDFGMAINPDGSDTIVTFNNAAATLIDYTTVSEHIGASCEVVCRTAGVWQHIDTCNNTLTVT